LTREGADANLVSPVSSKRAGAGVIALGLMGLASPTAAQVREAQQWAFSATVGESHIDNLLLSADDLADTMDTMSVGLMYGRTSERLSFSGYGRISGKRFRTFDQFNGLNYAGGGGISFHPSRAFAFSLSPAASSGFSTPLLLGLGVALPQIKTDVLRTASSGIWRASPRTTLKLDGDVSYLTYSSEVSTLEVSQLPTGTLALAGLIPPEEADIGLTGLPTPVDSSLVALGALSSEGVTRGHLNLFTYRAGLQVSQALTPRTTGTMQIGYRGLDYRRTDLRDGGQLELGTAIRQSLSPATTASLQYTYQRNTAQLPAVTTQSVLAQGEHDVNPHLKVDGSAGVGLTSRTGGGSSGTSLLGGLGASGRYRRTRFDARYGRSVFQALGFGRNYVSDSASAFVDHVFTKRLAARAGGDYRHSQDPLARQFAFTSQSYWGAARYRIQRRTVVSLQYVLRHFTNGADQRALNSSLVGFSLVYTRVLK